MQVASSGWPNETEVEVRNLRRLASPFGQGSGIQIIFELAIRIVTIQYFNLLINLHSLIHGFSDRRKIVKQRTESGTEIEVKSTRKLR